MKHLNPRQGITTKVNVLVVAARVPIPCETPKSPPGDYNGIGRIRRGIRHVLRVKHLNPRQGITTIAPYVRACQVIRLDVCETPKSPPGDYNCQTMRVRAAKEGVKCETPKSPPGDYNGEFGFYPVSVEFWEV